MKCLLSLVGAAIALAGAAHPAFGHVTQAGPNPHWHTGDLWGLGAVIALTAAAAWLARRRK